MMFPVILLRRLKLGWLAGFALFAGILFSASAQPYGLDSRPTVGPFLDNALPPVAPGIAANLSAVPAFPNLLFTNAVGLTFVPGTNLLCVWEREGRVWTFVNDSNTTTKNLLLDVSAQCQGWDDSGLLGLAFHPGYLTNHLMFVYYTWVVPGTVQGGPTNLPPNYVVGAYHDRLERYTITNGVADASSEFVLVDQVGNDAWHNGGGMFFHPTNGFLYWTDGDDADGNNTQIINQNLFSGVFRIDVDMRGGGISHPIPRQPANGTTANYFIPNDNPFVGQSNVLEEFFCLGLRSPHRMTVDPVTGRIFIGDVGDTQREEVDVIEPGESGLNFQWNRIEGLHGDLTPPYPGINRRPILDYTHSEGVAVIGGYVYRGSQFSNELSGKYIFGDYGARIIWAMDETTVPVSKVALCTVPSANNAPNSGNIYVGLTSFGLDAANEIYMCQMSRLGELIYKLAPAGVAPTNRPLPSLLSQAGAFTNLTTLATATGLIPYNVNSPLWSDGAIKTRWIALPTNSFINFTPTGEWTFPDGTVFVKHFELSVNDTNPAIRRRLETRLLVRNTNGFVYGASYKWRPDNSDADLVSVATNEDILITTATGTRTQTWTYPGLADCLRCHTTAAGGVLGVKTSQLNGDYTYPATGVTDNQLRAWNHIGMFSTNISESAISNYTKLVPVTDTASSLELRTRSYLDVNCAHCHQPGGVQAFFDARFDTPLTNQNLINGFVANTLGITNAKVVFPGDTNKSVLFQRVGSLGNIQMPPLARNVVDSNALATIAAWIASLSPITNSLPSPWTHTDIGDVGVPGDAIYNAGQFDLIASGVDIWNNADTFHFASQPFNGDGQITARLVSEQNTAGWAKAGVMFREDLTAGSRNVFMAITPAHGATFQQRATSNAPCEFTLGSAVAAPQWVRAVRAGSIFTGFTSDDGTNWSPAGAYTNAMAAQIYAGLALSSLDNSVLNQSVFDNVSVIATATTATNFTLALPSPWTNNDIGSVTSPGSATCSNGQFSVAITSDDIWNNADSFEFVSEPFTGNGQITARILSEQNSAGWAKAGVMFRENLTAGSRNTLLAVTPSNGTTFQQRDATDGSCVFMFGSDVAAPCWVRVARAGSLFTGFVSADGTNWSPVGAYTNAMDKQAYIGLALSSLNEAVSNQTVFDNVAVIATTNPPPVWLPANLRLTNGAFHLWLQGTINASYVVETSTNLKLWTPFATNSTTNNLMEFIEPTVTNHSYRFYRALEQ